MGISVYLHIPFCPAKCHYCSFLSFPASSAIITTGAYLSALEKELALRHAELSELGCGVSTLYIGGGTPTCLSAAELDRLLGICQSYLPIADAEWTVEANPGTLDMGKIDALASHSVNRISLGVQDLNDSRLALLGRKHTALEAREAFFLCRDKIPSLSVDLMSGLPGQTVKEFLHTLNTVLAWHPDHFSLYGLSIEDGTHLARLAEKTAFMPDDEEMLAMMLGGRETLCRNGFVHYEIANFARTGHACRHNLTYWHNEPYLGLGLGAHSYWNGKRLVNCADPLEYCRLLALEILPVADEITVTERRAMEDTMILGLRLLEGITFDTFQERFHRDMNSVFGREITRLRERGLLDYNNKGIRLTKQGYTLGNLVFAEFITV